MRTRRYEFSRQTKREALKRSGGFCEASGDRYGLDDNQRCNAPLSHGVEFDHYPVPATDPGSDVLENCVSCCPLCHGIKTRTYDVPMQAKGKRIRDKHLGIRPPSKLRGRGFQKAAPQRSATRKLSKTVNLIEEKTE